MSRFHLVSWLKASLFPFSRLTSCLCKLALRSKKLVKAVNTGFHFWISVDASTERKSTLFQSVYGILFQSKLIWVKTREISLNLSVGLEFYAPGNTWNIYVARVSANLILYLFWVCFGFCPKNENATLF